MRDERAHFPYKNWNNNENRSGASLKNIGIVNRNKNGQTTQPSNNNNTEEKRK